MRRFACGPGPVRQLDDFALALAWCLTLALLGRLLGPREPVGMALTLLAGSPPQDAAQPQNDEYRDQREEYDVVELKSVGHVPNLVGSRRSVAQWLPNSATEAWGPSATLTGDPGATDGPAEARRGEPTL